MEENLDIKCKNNNKVNIVKLALAVRKNTLASYLEDDRKTTGRIH